MAVVKKELIERMQLDIDFAIRNECDLDSCSWGYEEGVIITVNEARFIIDELNKD